MLAGVALTWGLAYYSCHLVWVSHLTHDMSQGADATPLWIPQIGMALGLRRAGRGLCRRGHLAAAGTSILQAVRRRVRGIRVGDRHGHPHRRLADRAADRGARLGVLDRPDAAGCGGVRHAGLHQPPGRRHHGLHHLGQHQRLDADRAAAVPVDGRDPVPLAAHGRHVHRPVALAQQGAGAAAACQRHRLRHLRGGVGFQRRHLRHHRQDHAARAEEARLPGCHLDGLAGRCRHLRPADPAVDHHDRLRRGHRRVDRQAVRGRCACRASC
jgi:hypothetical protein